MKLTTEALKAIMPLCLHPEPWALELQAAMDEFEISANKERVQRFLAQIAVESLELTRLDENLRYSAERLTAVWPKRFPTITAALPYANNPHKLADFVYANRVGNGGPESGDGWRYRGRGPKMITFRDNYAWIGKELGLPLLDCPEMLQTKKNGARSAAVFWARKGLNALADDLPDDDQDSDYVTITRRINGGTIGLDARIKYLKRAQTVLA